MPLKILLIQIRGDKKMAEHEFSVVARTAGLSEESITSINVLHNEKLPLEELKTYDAVIMGGSGGHSVVDKNSCDIYLEDAVRFCKENDIPFLGLCYGFQIAVNALGGKVINDIENMETGMYTLYRTDDSDNDPLVGQLPKEFLAGCGRQDRAETLPPGAVNYVYSDRCPYHYFTFPNSTFFAVQFHPELWKKEDNIIRIKFYMEKYGLDEEKLQEQLKMFQVDAPESAPILKNFIEVVKRNKRN